MKSGDRLQLLHRPIAYGSSRGTRRSTGYVETSRQKLRESEQGHLGAMEKQKKKMEVYFQKVFLIPRAQIVCESKGW